MVNESVLIRAENLQQYFPLKKSSLFQREQLYVRANDGITLDIRRGETLGLVGESGCGKSTFGRVLLQLYHQTGGNTFYYGHNLEEMAPRYAVKILERHWNLQEIDPNREPDSSYLELASVAGGICVMPNPEPGMEALREMYRATAAHRTEELPKYRQTLEDIRTRCAGNAAFERFEKFRETGIDLSKLEPEEMRRLRRELQMIFQDPYSSLNPRMTVGQIIGEGLLAHGICRRNSPELQEMVQQVMEDCGLAPYMLHRYPHQFSGGQRQRVGIARALALRPRFVVCDEAVSALDVSIQAQILNLLRECREREHLTYLFISHDLSVVKYLSDRIGVMYLGNLVELAPAEDLFSSTHHPYTAALLSAIPAIEKRKAPAMMLKGDLPSPVRPPSGCKFHPRCPHATGICKEVTPSFTEMEPGHFVACHHPL